MQKKEKGDSLAYNPQLYSTVPTGQPIYQNVPSVPMVQNQTVTPSYPAQFMQTPVLSVAYTQGEVGARSYLVAPNNTVVLLDSDSIDTENPIIYIKSTGIDGKPLPMRRIKGKSSYPNEQGVFVSIQSDSKQQEIDLTPYSTKEELANEIKEITDRLNNIDNVITDLNTNISNIDERFSNIFNTANNQSNQNNGNSSYKNHHNNGKGRNN